MADLQRIRCELTGITALPGVATFYSDVAVPSAKADVGDFWDALKTFFPASLSITVPSSGDVIDDATGALVGTWSEGSPETIVSTGSGAYAAGVGARVVWGTNGIRNGRRVRGSTFVCPLITSAYDSGGTLSTSLLTALGNAASTLAASGLLNVWSRPGPGGSPAGASNGILSASVPDRVTSLRSRRY